jgi:hypothetical protein
MPTKKSPLAKKVAAPVTLIERRIYLIRGLKVMIDSDLAELYGVETKILNRGVRRNLERFPEDFMFQLTKDEAESLRIILVRFAADHLGGSPAPNVFLGG